MSVEPVVPGPVIGLRREREVLTVALQTNRHVVLEGPPGTGKSTLLRAIAGEAGQDVVFVEGNAELTPARLVGSYDPAAVMAEGYVPGSFTDGPLLTAMRGSGLLYLEELNRIPEETLNVLITVLTEGEIAVPRLGTVRATAGFRLIAAMNPFDAIGTARVGQAIADRMCRVVLGYQDEPAERAIVESVTAAEPRPVVLAVRLVRATRDHRDLRTGSSVRGAIDLVLLLGGLLDLRGIGGLDADGAREAARDALHAALSGRIKVTEGVERTPEGVLDEILDRVWPVDAGPPPDGTPGAPPAPTGDGPGKAGGLPPEAAGPDAGGAPPERPGRRGPRQTSRRELELRHASFEEVSPEVGELDEDAFAAVMGADPDAAAALLADLALATDRELRSAARRLAARVFVQVGRVGSARVRGTRRLAPTRGGDGDLDLDRTLDRWSGPWPPAPEDTVTRRWTGSRRAVCLVVDRSGSMSGLGVAIAAVAAAGVVLAAGERLETSVLAFADRVEVLQQHGRHRSAEDLVLALVGLRGHGTTDVAAALRAAAAQLRTAAHADERVVVLLSDCLATAGDAAESALAGIDRLDVLCPLPDGGPEQEALTASRALAAHGGGSVAPVRSLTDLGPALSRLLA